MIENTIYAESLLSSLESKDWLNIILAIIGIAVSSIGLCFAIKQIRNMRTTAETVYQNVTDAQKRIRETMNSNEIGRAIKNLEQAMEYVRKDEYSHALTRMIDVKGLIENEKMICNFLPLSKRSSYDLQKRRFNESLKTLASDIDFPNNIDRRIIQNSLVEIHGSLLIVENCIKQSVYG